MPLKYFKKCVSLGSQTDAVEEIDAVTIRSVTWAWDGPKINHRQNGCGTFGWPFARIILLLALERSSWNDDWRNIRSRSVAGRGSYVWHRQRSRHLFEERNWRWRWLYIQENLWNFACVLPSSTGKYVSCCVRDGTCGQISFIQWLHYKGYFKEVAIFRAGQSKAWLFHNMVKTLDGGKEWTVYSYEEGFQRLQIVLRSEQLVKVWLWT